MWGTHAGCSTCVKAHAESGAPCRESRSMLKVAHACVNAGSSTCMSQGLSVKDRARVQSRKFCHFGHFEYQVWTTWLCRGSPSQIFFANGAQTNFLLKYGVNGLEKSVGAVKAPFLAQVWPRERCWCFWGRKIQCSHKIFGGGGGGGEAPPPPLDKILSACWQ